MKLRDLSVLLICLFILSCSKSYEGKKVIQPGVNPAVSPKQNVVAFCRIERKDETHVFKGYVQNIFEKNIIGSFGDGILDPVRLSWSPDGKKIAAGGFAEGKFNIWIFDPWGKEKPIMITDYQRKPDKEWVSSDSKTRFLDTQFMQNPSWAPTGELIAFSFHDIGKTAIWVVSLKDKNLEQLTQGPVDDQPCFSTDGLRIAYTTCTCDNGKEIMEVTLKDKTIQPLISSPFNEEDPAWSPNGKYIAFVSDRDRSNQIWIRRMSDSLEYQFTYGGKKETCYSPTWTPDGRYLLYSKHEVGGIWMKEFNPDIFKTHAR